MKIGIISSGGDCGGLNAVVKSAAQTSLNLGLEPYIISNGYAGLYNLIDTPPVELNEMRADNILSGRAGSEAGHSRVKIKKIASAEKYNIIKAGLEKHNIDALIIAGGDDTGSVVVDLITQGIRCIHCPKTMDLDLQPYSVGGDSTINRISNFVNDLRTTGQTHNRALVVEVFGRYAGHTAFRGGVGADADCILIPEIGADYKLVYEHFKKTYINRLKTSYNRASTYLIVAAEGVTGTDGKHFSDSSAGTDAFGHVRLSGVGQFIRKELEKYMKEDKEWAQVWKDAGMYVENLYEMPEVREVQPGHLVRCGQSTAYDVNFGKQIGSSAVHLLVNGIEGVTVVGYNSGKIKYMPTKEAIKERNVDLEEIAFFENMGVCFGREPAEYKPKFEKVEGKIERYM